MLHKFRKPEAVFQISQEWIITAPRRRNQSREETALASATVIKKSQNDNCCRKLRKLLARPPTPMGPSGLSWEGTPAASRAPYRDPALRGASLRVRSVQPGFCVTDTYTVRAEKWDTETRNARCYPRTQVSQNAPLECSEATEGFGVPGRTKPSSSTSDRGEISSFSALTAIVWHVKARWTSSTKLRGTVSMHWKAVQTHLISMTLPLEHAAHASGRTGGDKTHSRGKSLALTARARPRAALMGLPLRGHLTEAFRILPHTESRRLVHTISCRIFSRPWYKCPHV